jgi:hypothetical protein
MRIWQAAVLGALLCGRAEADMYALRRPLGAGKQERRNAPSQPPAGFVSTGAAQMGAVLRNLLADPGAVDHMFSNLFFQTDRGLLWPMLTGGAVKLIDVTRNGQWRVSSGETSGKWRLGHTTRPAEVPVLGVPGAGGWGGEAAPGIAGNRSLNPFLSGPAVLNLDLTGRSQDRLRPERR